MKKIISIILYPIFIFCFLSLLFFWDVIQKITYPFGLKSLEKVVYLLNYTIVMALKLVGTKFEVPKNIQLDWSKPYIIVSNHQSMFDMPLLYVLFKKLHPRYIAKKELEKWIPSISFCLRKTQAALIDRKNPKQAIPAIKELADRMKQQKFAVIIFPEGTRSKDGVLKRFRENGLKALLNQAPEVQVIPVKIDGTWRLTQNKYGFVPFGEKVRVKIGAVITRKNKSEQEIFDEALKTIQQLS